MIRPGASARAKDVALLSLAAALAACSSPKPPMTNLQREDAERQELIEAMKRHPSFTGGGDNAATGKPIDVPKTVPPKAEGADDQHDHPDPNPKS